MSKSRTLAYRLLTKPHVSEKVGALAEAGTYVFQVPPAAEKIAIKKAVEALYHVHVAQVRTARYAGKPIYRGRRPGSRKGWKKAFVTLKKGEKIELYEGV
ncbi:50S ribosomal protein L23 [Candidatus Uhrbacteria bacterium]|nr:50S ribosomal protein L23 [Candidatus Uhrbacteria bacterium]